MSWWKKSSYKQQGSDWWNNSQEEDEFENQSWSGGYRYSYKPRYDMSISVETRVTQLIKAITGKTLKLAQARAWGNDDKYFYYNPNDLANVSDDEVLGRILQQLGKELYLDKEGLGEFKKQGDEQAYRHLIDSLEANRADRQLALRYNGTRYYAQELWETRKVKDNPLTYYEKVLSFDKWYATQYNVDEAPFDNWKIKEQAEIKLVYEEYLKSYGGKQNDAWEFCFNIHAFQNGEKNFDFIKDANADNFTKALPFIDQYLNCPNFTDALKIYPDIKKYYPKPTEEEQQQMDRQMGQTQGLSTAELEELAKAMEKRSAQAGQNKERDANEVFFGTKAALDDSRIDVKRNLARYKQVKAEQISTINALAALIRSIIKDNQVKRYLRPFKRGKLDSKSMYKFLATGNLRIFKKPRAISKKDYTMAIMVDQSGSMEDGGNSTNALRGAIVLAEVFEQLDLPYELLGFSDEVYVYKAFDKALSPAIVPSLEDVIGGTDDINALRVLREHVKKFDPSQTHHKGIFVITDGEGVDQRAMKNLVSQIERENNTTIFGIGIGNVRRESLQQSYNNFIKVDNAFNLPSTLVELMRTQFKRG